MGRLGPADFHTVHGFRRPDVALVGLTPGLRSGLSLHPPPEKPKLRCCSSSLYTFPAEISLRTWLGIANLKVPPNLSSSASTVSHASTQVFLKSTAYAIPPRPARLSFMTST